MKFKRLLSLFLALVTVLAVMSSAVLSVSASGLTLSELRQKFPHGKYWNGGDPDSYTSTPCYNHDKCNWFMNYSLQCAGYGDKLGYDATGYNPRENRNGWMKYTTLTAVDNLKPGDIVRYLNDQHTFYVTGVDGETITYTDCNAGNTCIIRWDSTITKTELKKTFTYVQAAPFSILKGEVACDCSYSYVGEYNCTVPEGYYLKIFNSPSTDSNEIGQIFPGDTVAVTKGDGTWAHVEYRGISGYATLSYLEPTVKRDTKIKLWFSNSQMGETAEYISPGETMYLCYKIYDDLTGERYDNYTTIDYNVKVTFYTPYNTDGYVYDFDYDNNWISLQSYRTGIYEGKLEFTSDQADTITLEVAINLIDGVTIIKQPQNVAVQSGKTAKVTVDAIGEGLRYKWYVKNKGASKFSLSSAYTGNYYSAPMDADRVGRQVYCIITDKYGKSVRSNTVTLGMAAKITKQPQSVSVQSGKTAKVTVTASGEGKTYKWYFKDKGASKFTLTDSYKSNTYDVTMNATRAGRQVYCVVTDKYGNSVKSNTVTLGMAAKITKQPTTVSVQSGKTAKVTVSASGEGLKYQWYFKNKGDSKFTLTNSYKSNTYSVEMNGDRAGRQVYCVITDKYGNSVKTNTVTLGMAVKITKQPTSVTVANGKTAKVTVSASGEGRTYKWYVKNKGETKFTLTTSFTGSSYYITMNNARAGRQVYCIITDKYGNKVKTNTVTLNKK
ncbi:MAG: SH3 domain-containing protein [Clostridia bacterium]|nr:SH3 domain-containing protein [Clostridia bacterium]